MQQLYPVGIVVAITRTIVANSNFTQNSHLGRVVSVNAIFRQLADPSEAIIVREALMPHTWLTSRVLRVIDWMILVLGVLAVPFTHGVLEYVGLIFVASLLIALNHVIARKNRRLQTTARL